MIRAPVRDPWSSRYGRGQRDDAQRAQAAPAGAGPDRPRHQGDRGRAGLRGRGDAARRGIPGTRPGRLQDHRDRPAAVRAQRRRGRRRRPGAARAALPVARLRRGRQGDGGNAEQARGNDIANLTIVEGEDGLVVIDCMTGVESARQGLALFREHVSDKPVAAVVYTHTHSDHYGGVKGVVDPADVASGKVPIIAPGTIASFDKYATGESVLVGNAMSRRASYAFGGLLDIEPLGAVGCGIGIISTHAPVISYISPTDPVTQTGTKRELAGLEFEFLYAPDTEAPEEMHIWIPQLKALTCAENANHSLHNIQTLRGVRTRDARNFARYLDETLEHWGDEAEVHWGPHTWPVWGNENIAAFIGSQRDTYKYIHDQALRLANKGYTPLEAAEVIELPEELRRKWFNRGYHGTLHHDVRAVYTKGAEHVGRRPGLTAPASPGGVGQAVRRSGRRGRDPGRRPPRDRGRGLPVGS